MVIVFPVLHGIQLSWPLAKLRLKGTNTDRSWGCKLWEQCGENKSMTTPLSRA